MGFFIFSLLRMPCIWGACEGKPKGVCHGKTSIPPGTPNKPSVSERERGPSYWKWTKSSSWMWGWAHTQVLCSGTKEGLQHSLICELQTPFPRGTVVLGNDTTQSLAALGAPLLLKGPMEALKSHLSLLWKLWRPHKCSTWWRGNNSCYKGFNLSCIPHSEGERGWIFSFWAATSVSEWQMGRTSWKAAMKLHKQLMVRISACKDCTWAL